MINTIVFDLGAVLIDWNPRYVYRQLFVTDDAMEYFLSAICNSAWNEMQDAGRSFGEATHILTSQYPEYTNEILAYYGRWEEMLNGPIDATVDLFLSLKSSKKYQILALTNWSAESFPVALAKYDFLSLFDGILVSGEEKLKKPDPAIFHLLIERYNLSPEKCLFIDDNITNVKSAEDLGFNCIHFTDVERDIIRIKNLLH